MSCLQECRPIFCAGNNLVSNENLCPDSDVDILSNDFSLCLNITFYPMISFITFQQIISNASHYLPTWVYQRSEQFIYYKMTEDIVDYAILKKKVLKNKRSYNNMIKGIQQRLSMDVFTEINDQKIRVVQRVGDFCLFSTSPYNSSYGKIIPLWINKLLQIYGNEHILEPIVNVSEFIFEKRRIRLNMYSDDNPQITKLSFCRQVELTKHEATVIEDMVLYVNLTGKLVFDFVATRDLLTTDVRVRVCLEDFPYDELRMSSGSSNWFARLLVCILALSLWLLFL